MTPVLIAGPTASGKSALALAVAERDGGCVINADALQVYRCWRVLTARPSAADCARAPHLLYGHVPCDVGYSVGDWLREVAPAIDAARDRGERPVIVGGAGLYFAALTQGLAEIPKVPAEVRARSDAMLDAGRLDAMLADLARDDPATLAGLDRRNPARVQRAWEVLAATGRGLASWRRAPATPVLPAHRAVAVCLWPETPTLDAAIRRRFEAMMDGGALDEAAAFRARGGDPGAPAGRALGAAALIAHLDGHMSRAAAVEAAVLATRRYAKRQRTWFRARMADWTAIDPAAPGALARIPAL